MTRFAELLSEIIQTLEKQTVTIKSSSLKDKLLKDFPQLVFILYEGAIADFIFPATEEGLELDSNYETASEADFELDDAAPRNPGKPKL